MSGRRMSALDPEEQMRRLCVCVCEREREFVCMCVCT